MFLEKFFAKVVEHPIGCYPGSMASPASTQESAIERLRPVPGRIEYLVSVGSLALISTRPAIGEWPLELEAFEGRQPLGIMFKAHLEAVNKVRISVSAAARPAALPYLFATFLRACIRRAPGDGIVYWSSPLDLPAEDPLSALVQSTGTGHWLSANHRDLRPAERLPASDVYAWPADVPWVYDPLDYDAMLPILGRSDIGRVLDLGSGTGRNAVPLENAGYEVHGIDPACDPPAFVRRPDRFHRGRAQAMPFADGWFDAVLDVGCLHMDPAGCHAAAQEINRVLRPGGLVCGRALKPMGACWMAAQPFLTDAVGLSINELATAFDGFELRILHDFPYLTYYSASRT